MSEFSNSLGTVMTSDVNEIISLFLERGSLFISDRMSITDSSNIKLLEVISVSIKNSNLCIEIQDGDTITDREFPITVRYGHSIVKSIRVSYSPNSNAYPIILYNSITNIMQLCDPDIYPKEGIVEYFTRFFDFVIDNTDEPLKRTECNKYDDPDGDTVVVNYISVADLMDETKLHTVPMRTVTFEFDRFGKLTSHTCIFDSNKELIMFFTMPVEPEDDGYTKEFGTIEEAFNDISNSIKALQTAITNLSEEVQNKLADLYQLKRSLND